MGFGLLPKNITREYYLENMCDYTPIALSCKSLFYLQQNLVTRVLTPGAPDYISMVEECFPDEAMTDQYVFFDAVGDEEKFQRNVAQMMDSCGRFIDFDKIDVVPTSQYVVNAVRG